MLFAIAMNSMLTSFPTLQINLPLRSKLLYHAIQILLTLNGFKRLEKASFISSNKLR